MLPSAFADWDGSRLSLCLAATGADKCPKSLEIRAFGQKERTATLIRIVSKLRFLFGGGEENRTPVRKFIHIGISECSLSFPFPYPVADKQAKGLGILLYIVHAGGTLRRRSPLIDARIRIRGPIRPDGCLIKQQMQRYCCRLILSVRFLRGPAPLLASHASKSPSRPLRPQIFDAISFLFCFLIV